MNPAAKALIVDDEEDLTELLSTYFTQLGFECTTAGNGQEALSHLEKTDFDVMVTDLSMEPINGLQLVQSLKDLPRNQDLPTIMLSGYLDQVSSRQVLEQMQNVVVVEKPCPLDRLHSLVRLFALGRRRVA